MTDGWTIVDRARHWDDKKAQVAEAIVRNAIRLLDDATLLQTYERYATAFTIATIAFEEAGKVALEHWSDNDALARIGNGWTYHLKKTGGCWLPSPRGSR